MTLEDAMDMLEKSIKKDKENIKGICPNCDIKFKDCDCQICPECGEITNDIDHDCVDEWF